MIYGVKLHRDLPLTIKYRICDCGETLYAGPYPLRIPYKNVCGECFKPRIERAYQCVDCEAYFVRHGDTNFEHPLFCSFNPRCWNCLQELPEDMPITECCSIHAKYTGEWLKHLKGTDTVSPKRIEGAVDGHFDFQEFLV